MVASTTCMPNPSPAPPLGPKPSQPNVLHPMQSPPMQAVPSSSKQAHNQLRPPPLLPLPPPPCHYIAAWFYYAKGSGVWFNLGKTWSGPDHADAFKYFRVNGDSAKAVRS